MDDELKVTVDRRAFLAGGAAVSAALVPLLDPALSAAATSKSHGKGTKGKHAKHKPKTTKPRTVSNGLPASGPIYAQHANPADLGVLESASLLQAGLVSSQELTAACQARITARNGPISFAGSATTINAWVRLYDTFAGQLSTAADAVLAKARKQHTTAPLLSGVPIGLKDLYAVNGLGLTASSNILAGNVATGDSSAWARLKAAGMVLCGHTQTDEFAFLAVTPQCGNPWDTSLITGGSSGGSAAALASRMIPAAMGSDTLGSLRIPAAFCGVSSIKPTFGLVSTYGVIPLAWSLDHCGPMARTVGDCSLMLTSLAGEDISDPSSDVSASRPRHYPTLPRSGSKPLTGTRIGMPNGLGTPDAGPGEIYARTISELEALGATVIAVDVPANPFNSSTSSLQFYTEALEFHSPYYPSRVADYRPPAAQLLSLIKAENLTALQYLSLHRQRAAYQTAWKTTFASHDLDAVAFLVSLGDPVARNAVATQSPVSNPENSKLLTYEFSYLGFPVVTVPGGASSATKLPVGIQIGGAPFTEAELIQIAIDLQAHFPHYEEVPPGLAAT